MVGRRDWDRQKARQLDTGMGRMFATAIVVLSAIALLLLLFSDRSDHPRVINDNSSGRPPSQGAEQPPPTTPAPTATPRSQQ